jgi:serine/threonine protein kinase
MFQEKSDSASPLTESTVKNLVFQILVALNYLKNLQILHRDLKPENIMLESPNSLIKIIDFGFGLDLSHSHDELRNYILGTMTYLSPELIENQEYCCESDIWSLGVIIFSLLANRNPFYDRDDKILFRLIQSCDYEFKDRIWSEVTSECKQFIESCLEPSISKRLTPT